MNRKDNWTKAEDDYLVTTILNCIAIGETQLSAFSEVGLKINRTPAACGFRWNSTLRHQQKEAIFKAKALKLTNKIKRKNIDSEKNCIDTIITYLLKLKDDFQRYERDKEILHQKIHNVSLEIQQRRSEIVLDMRANSEALAMILAKASDLGLFEQNKKPAI